MGELLTVNFRQPSHEFTFNVGIDLISKLTILPSSYIKFMWVLKFIDCAGNKHLNEDFWVKFIEHLV
jgi:hypothetical protein